MKLRLSLQIYFAWSLAESNVRSNPPLRCWCNSGLRLLLKSPLGVVQMDCLGQPVNAASAFVQMWQQTAGIRRGSSREEHNGSQSDQPDLNGIVSKSLEVPVQPPPACKGTTLGAFSIFTRESVIKITSRPGAETMTCTSQFSETHTGTYA